MQISSRPTYILGLDIGSASLGWGVVETANGIPRKVLAAGALIFNPGVTNEKNAIERGKDESRAKARRVSRSHRRQLRRHADRLQQLFARLQRLGFLPRTEPLRPTDDPTDAGQARQRTLDALDKELVAKWRSRLGDGVAVEHLLPYALRKHALDEALEPRELGRVFMHLCQRRGFESNRKTESLDEQQSGTDTSATETTQGETTSNKGRPTFSKIYGAIQKLWQEITDHNARTLGEYLYQQFDFAKLRAGVPEAHRIRERWTERKMYEEEFDAIWTAQARHHPMLRETSLRDELRNKVFHQRPLKSNQGLIGFCELEYDPDKAAAYDRETLDLLRRAPWKSPEAQKFRLVQRVNDLKIIPTLGAQPQELTENQRKLLTERLESFGDQTYAALRELLELPEKARFNFERLEKKGAERVCKGNRTISIMRQAFGGSWKGFTTEKQDQIVRAWQEVEKKTALAQVGQEWGLSPEVAEQWSRKTPEPGYCSLSLVAIRKLLPLMEKGMSYANAVQEIYTTKKKDPLPFLPPVRATIPELRNPAVERALTEVRKLVNEVIRKYERPQELRIELARDLKKPRDLREEIYKRNNERRDERRKSIEKILTKCPGVKITNEVVEKCLLWEECKGRCPYTDEPLEFTSLIRDGAYQVEHILPLSLFGDDSFQNKTLCHPKANADKKNNTPWEAYHLRPQEYEAIQDRVAGFRNPGKLARFRMDDEAAAEFLKRFTGRQLNDTAYSSRKAADYIGRLYGGREINGRRVIQVTSGEVTAKLRKAWGLEKILGGNPADHHDGRSSGKPSATMKGRHDHRHHAIDAIVIALTSDKQIKRLNDQAAENLRRLGKETYKDLPEPIENFVDQVGAVIKGIIVYHRPEHKLGGPLHNDTNYSPPRDEHGRPSKAGQYVHLRRDVNEMLRAIIRGKAKEETTLKDIVDQRVRDAVGNHIEPMRRHLEEYKEWRQLNAKKKKSEINWNEAPQPPQPHLLTRRGDRVVIKKVRVREKLKVQPVGQFARQRYVSVANNHHIEVVAELDSNGVEKRWAGCVIDRLEAMRRQAKSRAERRRGEQPSEPVVEKHFEVVAKLKSGDKRIAKKRSIVGRASAEIRAEKGELKIIRQDAGCRTRFKFSLMGNDTVRMDHPAHPQGTIFVLRTISKDAKGRVELDFVRHNDARPIKDIQNTDKEKGTKDWVRARTVDDLREWNCRKVVVDLLGGTHVVDEGALEERAGKAPFSND